jgi:hypothetical protein
MENGSIPIFFIMLAGSSPEPGNLATLASSFALQLWLLPQIQYRRET